MKSSWQPIVAFRPVLPWMSCWSGGKSALKLDPCFNADLNEKVLCGSFKAIENRQTFKGRKIDLNLVVLPARGPDPVPDPIFFLAGGPGGSAVSRIRLLARRFDKLRQDRDIVFLDQRGTGSSNPLPCRRLGDPESAQTYIGEMYPAEYVTRCREELERKADLRFYDTTVAMDDLDEVREALGYDRINLIGGSYGTRAGIVYMQRYPDRVRSAFLHFVTLPGLGHPAQLAPNLDAALERLFQDCAADSDCATDYPNLRQEVNRVVARIKEGPIQVTIRNPWTDLPETVTYSSGPFIQNLRWMMNSNSSSKWLPAFFHQAAQGDYSHLASWTAEDERWVNEEFMEGMYLSVICTEDYPFIDFEEARKVAEGTIMGDYRLEQHIVACGIWPRGELPEGFADLKELDIPALIVSGELDPTEPPEEGEKLAATLPNSLHVVIANEGSRREGRLGRLVWTIW